MKNVTVIRTVGSKQVVDGLVSIKEASAITDGMAKEWYGNLVLSSVKLLGEVFNFNGSQDNLKQLFVDGYEKAYKKETGDKSMPGAYRSAKSVITKAITFDVELLNEDGTPRGKTEVEKDIKELQAVKTNVEKIDGLLETVSKLIDSAKSEGESLAGVAQTLTDLYKKVIA